MRIQTALLAAATGVLLTASALSAQAVRNISGFTTNTLARNDDGFVGPVSIGFMDPINFFGTSFSSLFVNNNGNVTFGAGAHTYTPHGIATTVPEPIIAAFFGDVDTNGAGSAELTYGNGTVNGHDAFGVDWPGVGYYSANDDKLNIFQLLLIDRRDLAIGDFDIEFNYGRIRWEVGQASGDHNPVNGLCDPAEDPGTSCFPADVGYSNGLSGADRVSFELPGSGVAGAFIDGGPHALISHSNIGVPGRYFFEVRNGTVIQPPSTVTPEPGTLLLMGTGLLLLGFLAYRRRRGYIAGV